MASSERPRRGPPELPPGTDIFDYLLTLAPDVREEMVRSLGMEEADGWDREWSEWAHGLRERAESRSVPRMGRTGPVIVVMLLAPPLLIYALVRAGAFASHNPAIAYGAFVGAWAIGMAALAASGWPLKVRLWVGAGYTLVSIPALPFLALLTVCTTGDCI